MNRYWPGRRGKDPSPRRGDSDPTIPVMVPMSVQPGIRSLNQSNPLDIITFYAKWRYNKQGEREPDRHDTCKAAVHALSAKETANILKHLSGLAQSRKENFRTRLLPFRLTTKSRLALWLASPTPVEVGLCLHPVYGIPYIPGSALKGVALRGARTLDGMQPAARDRIFGIQAQAGMVDFLPAFPEPDQKAPLLETDIMTPHYGKWYKEGVFTERNKPTPLHFLVVPECIRFEGALLHRGNETGAQEDLERAWKSLEEGLDEFGLGAKTSAGYGWVSLSRIQSADNEAEKSFPEERHVVSSPTAMDSAHVSSVPPSTEASAMREARSGIITQIEAVRPQHLKGQIDNLLSDIAREKDEDVKKRARGALAKKAIDEGLHKDKKFMNKKSARELIEEFHGLIGKKP